MAELRLDDNVLLGGRSAIRFDGVAANLSGAVFSRNLMLGIEDGGIVNWFESPTGWTTIEGCTVVANRDALRLGANDLRVRENEISGGTQSGDGVHLIENIVPEAESDVQIIGNHIGELSGVGIRIEGQYASLLIKRNVIRRCGEAGIASTPEARIVYLAIDNNVIEDIAETVNQQDAGGIVITRAETGQINGNTVRNVGLGGIEGALYAGIALFGVGQIAVESNAVSGIGPEDAVAASIAIMGRWPFFGLSVQTNRLLGALTPENGQGIAWIGVDLGQTFIGDEQGIDFDDLAAISTRMTVPGLTPGDLTFAEVDGTVFVMAASVFSVAGPAREPQISICGNQLHNAAKAALSRIKDRRAAADKHEEKLAKGIEAAVVEIDKLQRLVRRS